MHINGEGLCRSCKHFRHECPSWSESDERGCEEWCESRVDGVSEMFLDATDDIVECAGYEEE